MCRSSCCRAIINNLVAVVFIIVLEVVIPLTPMVMVTKREIPVVDLAASSVTTDVIPIASIHESTIMAVRSRRWRVDPVGLGVVWHLGEVTARLRGVIPGLWGASTGGLR